MIAELLVGLQVLLLVYFCYFGFYNILYGIANLKKPKLRKVKPSGKKVAVVIVSFNEKEVIIDTIKACDKLKYKNKVIIVGDDSNDEEANELLREYAELRGCKKLHDKSYIDHGKTEVYESEDFVLFHRKTNEGFKAGNLKEMESYLKAKGFDYMYLLDADWWPQEDAIERCLEVLEADDKIAFVQTKRKSYHEKKEFLRRCLALNENGCYFVDLPGRQAIGDPVLFTGCCTMFHLGRMYNTEGFRPGHLTEDIDLTNRLYLLGYKGVYLEDVSNEGEVPPCYRTYRKQQERWAMGSVRVFLEYFIPIIKSKKLSIKQKLGMLRQNAYFTTAIAIELSIVLAVISVLMLYFGQDNFTVTLYRYYLQKIGLPYTILLFVALFSNFIAPLITSIKNKRYENIPVIPYATWLSWSVLHTYFLANLKGIFKAEQDWFHTPKTNRKATKKKGKTSHAMRAFNIATLVLLSIVYLAEWFMFGWFDVYSVFWIPALVVGIMFG